MGARMPGNLLSQVVHTHGWRAGPTVLARVVGGPLGPHGSGDGINGDAVQTLEALWTRSGRKRKGAGGG